MRVSQLCFALVASVISVNAHIALWDEGMYGWDPNDPNQSEPVLPLMHLPFNEWWFHGYIDKPPADGKIMNLPSGGTYHGQVACNKALTSYGQNADQQTGIYACDGDGATGGIGAMHTSDQWASSDPKDVKGCGIAIAYESDVKKIQPEDFTVISVNYTCPWFKHVDFQIPSDLPPCPEGGCHCMWGWIHAADAGSEQNYFLGYRCNITDATGITPLPSPKTANKCNYPTDTSNCTVGAKQPHYWYQAERNNNPQGEYDPPFYNNEYGFINGAQTDLFAAVGGNESATTSTSASASSVSASASSASSVAASGAFGDSQPSTTVATSSESTTSTSVSQEGTIQTTVTVQTTMTRSASIAAQVAIATSDPSPATSSSAATSSATSSATATAGSGKTCSVQKKKRHLERLINSPDLIKKHLERRERRKERLRKRRIESGVKIAKMV
ncbi:uncharacterized protein L199_005902 [Kwoniella botswanensis]|uniref:uncharacterized protein n=1 Tax=Kwoniella botswanensis TaxID=1268659 RepID=UPI00315DFA1F